MSDRFHGPPPTFPAPVLCQAELDDLAGEFKCQCPECKGKISNMSIQPKCHKGAGLDVAYLGGSGVIEIRCNECGRPIIGVKVAP